MAVICINQGKEFFRAVRFLEEPRKVGGGSGAFFSDSGTISERALAETFGGRGFQLDSGW